MKENETKKGRWLSSAEFANQRKKTIRAIQKKVQQAKSREEKILAFDTLFFMYRYEEGIGGGGKVLQIWSEPLNQSEETPQEIDRKALVEAYEQKKEDSFESIFFKSPQKAQEEALMKRQIIREWEKAKKAKLGEGAFFDFIFSKYNLRLSSNKLFSWQRKYRQSGLDGLVDMRGIHRAGVSDIETLGLKEECERLILAQKGRVNVANIHRALNYHATDKGMVSALDFLGKHDEAVSYEIVYRFVNTYLENHRLAKDIILYGEDGAISRHLPALGKSNWAATSINQIVEIDASPLDVICNVPFVAQRFGVEEKVVEEWQKRYCIIGLIDTYSGVCTMHIADTENSISVSRAIAKYISRYGKPLKIKGDNGKAFLSKHTQEVMNRLDIEYVRVRAYSGWMKPFVERNFKTIQHQFIEWMAGYIGHNITERQAIEFFFGKKERRLGKGKKTNLQRLQTIDMLGERLDTYCESILANTYREGLGGSPKELFDKKAHEAIYMSPIELTSRLSVMVSKKVNKKGVSIDGIDFQSPALFGHDKVFVAQNLNNINEVFVFDEEKRFLDMAQTLDQEEVSVEEAKQAQKVMMVRLKEEKKKIHTARVETEEQMARIYSAVGKSLETPAFPKALPVNIEAAAMKSAMERAKQARTSEISDRVLKAKEEEKTKEKRTFGFEKAVLGA